MADESKRPNEVILNGVWYPLVGQLSRVLTSVWPEKTVIGDYTKASDPYVESWSIADQRGGVLIEEMDEQKHANRCYWSTCNLGFKGHIILPPLATSVTIADTTGGASASLSCTNSGFETDTTGWEQVGTVTLTRDTVNKHSGSASLALTNMGAGEGVKYAVTWNSSFQGKSVTASMWHRGGTSSEDMHLAIYDGVGTTNGTAVSGDTTFQLMTVTRTLSSSASELSIRAMWDSGAGDHNIDDLMLSGLPVNGDVVKWITFNSKWYMAKGSWLMKLDADGDEFTAVKSDLGAAITDLIATSDYLYIYCGDTAPYWYMNTSETFVQSPGYNNTYGIYWDDKLFKTDSEGQLAYYTTPASQTPTSTNNGKIPIDDNDIQRLQKYYNIDGDDVIYASTKKGIWVHDYANAKWLQSQLKVPAHTNSGKGFCSWRDGLFVTAGLDGLKYIPSVPVEITSMGLDRDDGLPVEYAGEITWLEPGYNEIFAAVDSSQVSGTGYSTIMAWDENGWQCKWADSSADSAIHALGVAAVYAYRLWFDDANVVYYIPLHRNLRNPLKISTDTYGTASMHITPWFDADWSVGEKLAHQLKVNVGGDVSADETVVVKYRTDHTNTDRDTGWTTLGTIVSSGETAYTFGSNLGTNFKSIQFRFDLARAGGSTTETPDILYIVLEYSKILPKRWGYRFQVDCSRENYHGKTSKQLLEALVTASELETLTTLVYDTTTYYVQVKEVSGQQLTGQGREGVYEVFCSEVL